MFSNDVGLFKEAKKGRIGGLISSTILCYVFFVAGVYISIPIQGALSGFLPLDSIGGRILGALLRNLISIVLVAIWIKLKEKRKFSGVGFTRNNFIGKYLFGFLIGITIFSLVVLILKLTGHIEINTDNTGTTGVAALSGVFLLVPVWIVQGASEEILTRGWLMHVLGAKYNVIFGLIVSALFFGAVHISNAEISIIALLNIVLVGIFFGLYIIKAKSIWGACGMHSAWNWAQGNIYGFEVSGSKVTGGSLFGYKLVGAEWFTGGDFGPEAGFAATIVLVIAIIIVIVVNRKKRCG